MPTLLGEGEPKMNDLLYSIIDQSQIHYVGLRDIDDTEKIRLEAGNIYHPRSLDISDLVSTLKAKGISYLYLHFDFDCLEPQDYDKTYYRVPDGTTINEAIDCIQTLQEQFNIVGSSVLESITIAQEELRPIEPIIDLLMR